jgi:hypothetical protein
MNHVDSDETITDLIELRRMVDRQNGSHVNDAGNGQ